MQTGRCAELAILRAAFEAHVEMTQGLSNLATVVSIAPWEVANETNPIAWKFFQKYANGAAEYERYRRYSWILTPGFLVLTWCVQAVLSFLGDSLLAAEEVSTDLERRRIVDNRIIGSPLMSRSIVPLPVRTIQPDSDTQRLDLLAVEEPLEIRLNGKPVSITMRTPGHDRELATGFLFVEGLLRSPVDIAGIAEPRRNSVDIVLNAGVDVEAARLDRNFYMTSSCGVCGKASLEALEKVGCPMLPEEAPTLDAAMIHQLPSTLRSTQSVFDQTGGLHAAALFDFTGRLLKSREDVGRHNALDKLVGSEFLDGRLPLSTCLLLVSGRVSFELIQKALMAGIPAIAAVGAPSSLAVELALRSRMTLIGFVRDRRFNVYSGASRIDNASQPAVL